MPQFGHLHDDSIYFVSAKSIAQGHGYRILSLPGEPYQTKYPPLFPLLLALVWKINPNFPANVQLAGAVCWSMLPAFLAVSWLFYKWLGLPRWQSLTLIGLLGLNFWVVDYSINVMPELMFSTLLLASVVLADKATEHSDSWEALAAAILASAAYLTKSAAIPLLISVPIVFLLRKRIRCAVVFFATMLVVVIVWNLWVFNHRLAAPDENDSFYLSYLGFFTQTMPLGEVPGMIVQNVRTLVFSTSELLGLNGSNSALGTVIKVLITGAAFTGLVLVAKRFKLSHYHAFAACYMALLVVCNFPPAPRYFLPLIPLLLAGLFFVVQESMKGLVVLFKRDSFISVCASLAFSALLATGLAVIFMSYGSIPWIFLGIQAEWRAQQVLRRPTYDFVAQHIPASSAFIAHEDPLFYLYTGRHARSLHTPSNLVYSGDEQAIEMRYRALSQFAREHRLDYLFLTADDFYREAHPDDIRSVVQRLVRTDANFELLRQDDGGSIYKIHEPASVSVGNGIIPASR